MPQEHTEPKAVPLFHIRDQDSLTSFVRNIHKYPMLEAGEEYELATEWHQKKSTKALEKLLGSHLRLVFKIAQGYRGYGLALHDLVAEGNIGMMQALHKFKPEKGFRFSTYAMWWIRAAIQDHVLKNWSLVKMGTTAAQKKLFFNLKKLRAQLDEGAHHLSAEVIEKIAEKLEVSSEEVIEMSQRMHAPDYSLNAPVKEAGEGEWQDWLEDAAGNHETAYFHRREMEERQALLEKSMEALDHREHHILRYRRLHEPPKTLEELSTQFALSKERIRQIEVAAFHKLQLEVRKHHAAREYN